MEKKNAPGVKISSYIFKPARGLYLKSYMKSKTENGQVGFFLIYIFFLNIGPSKEGIFLTTFYGLYFSHSFFIPISVTL